MSKRDQALCALAALVAVCLVVMAWVHPPAPEAIQTGLVAIGVGAIGRLSGAGTSAAPDPAGPGEGPEA